MLKIIFIGYILYRFQMIFNIVSAFQTMFQVLTKNWLYLQIKQNTNLAVHVTYARVYQPSIACKMGWASTFSLRLQQNCLKRQPPFRHLPSIFFSFWIQLILSTYLEIFRMSGRSPSEIYKRFNFFSENQIGAKWGRSK